MPDAIQGVVHTENLVGTRRGGRRSTSSGTRAALPPRRSAFRRRAISTMTERITRPAQRMKCTRSSSVKWPRPGESKIRLVHERARIEERVPASSAQPRARETAQIGVGRRKQRVGRFGVAGPRAVDQLRQRDIVSSSDRAGRALGPAGRLALFSLKQLHSCNTTTSAMHPNGTRGGRAGSQRANRGGRMRSTCTSAVAPAAPASRERSGR